MRFTSETSGQAKDLKVKFYFDDESEDAGVELKFITDEEKQAAHKLLVKEEIEFAIHPNTKKLTKVVTPEFDVKDLEGWFLDTLIVSWWGLWLDEKEIECTKENKVLLYNKHKEFMDFVDEKNNELTEIAGESYGSSSKEGN